MTIDVVIVMYVKRSISKILRTIGSSAMFTQMRYRLVNTPMVWRILDTLPTFSVLLFSVYIGLGLPYLLVDVLFACITFLIVLGK